MQIKRTIKNKEDGSLDITFALTEEQANFLINFAVATLVQRGVLEFIDDNGDINFNEIAQHPSVIEGPAKEVEETPQQEAKESLVDKHLH